MCMYARSSIGQHLSLPVAVMCMLLSSCLSSCWQRSELPEDQAKIALREALTALQQRDVDGYMQRVDLGCDMDSVQENLVRHALEQHQDRQDRVRGAAIALDMIDAEMCGDSVCLVFYQMVFPDSTAEVACQKMVRVGSEWKIRPRN